MEKEIDGNTAKDLLDNGRSFISTAWMMYLDQILDQDIMIYR